MRIIFLGGGAEGSICDFSCFTFEMVGGVEGGLFHFLLVDIDMLDV